MKFYITTAIDYPNSVPHLGHAYEKVVADFYARWYRLSGAEVRFLTGLDEHGEKIQEAARAQGESPQQFVDRLSVNFRDLWTRLEISNDDFIRTSEPRHQRFAAEFYRRVAAKGDTYRGFYEGDYCVACETFYTRTQLKDGACPVHGTPTARVKEESYFFRLSKYRDWIREHIQSHPDFVHPPERRNELLSRLEDEVRDLSISRSTFNWGIPLPDDPKHVLYVWFDALINYLSALPPPDLFEKFWPADVHLIGKDIIWFHAVVWPAMLHAAGYPLPKQVMAHGFILDQHGVRMSKTLGNVVDPVEVVRDFGPDVLRYYFLRTFSSGQDGAFSVNELRERYANELGNDLGNLVMRVAKLVTGKLGGTIGPRSAPADLEFEALVNEYSRAVEEREHHRAMDVLWTYVRRTNGYLNAWAPWKIEDRERLTDVLYNSLEALRAIAHLLFPAMPATAGAIARSLGFKLETIAGLRFGTGSFQVTLAPPLFPRREEPTEVTASGGEPAASASRPQQPPASSPPSDPFSRLEVRVGLIRDVQNHPAADALYVLSVELGGETRTICAGLRKHLTIEELKARKVVVLANLKPAKLRGIESQGMVLATDRKDGKVAPVDPGGAAPGELVCAAGIPTAPKPKITIEEFQKAPLLIQGGKVVYRDPQGRLTPLFTPAGELVCDAEDGAVVR